MRLWYRPVGSWKKIGNVVSMVWNEYELHAICPRGHGKDGPPVDKSREGIPTAETLVVRMAFCALH